MIAESAPTVTLGLFDFGNLLPLPPLRLADSTTFPTAKNQMASGDLQKPFFADEPKPCHATPCERVVLFGWKGE
jgi:hypothetical protein